MNTNREDIISRYRDRIATGQRTKLTDAEQTQLIEAFVERLRNLTTEAEIKALCESELALLEEGYQKATIAKDRLRHYRKAIKVAMADGKLLMTAETSRVYTYTPRDSDESVEAHDHRALDFLKYDHKTYSTIAEDSATRNNEKQDRLKPVSLADYISKATELLQSSDPFEMVVGIVAVTGRRFSEAVGGGMELTDQPYWVTFLGQLKKRGEADSYLIPCLVPAADILSVLDRFRSHPRIVRVVEMAPQDINRSLANSVKLAVQRHFTGIVPTLDAEAGLTIHNLRGVYAEIAVHYFCPPDRGVARFVQETLGHAISEQEMKRSNASATQHYFHYFLTDENGKHVGAKGVKLDQGKALPIPEPTIVRQPETQIKTAIAAEKRTDQQDSTNAIALLAEQVANLKKEIQTIWNHMNTQAPTATDTTLLIREIETLRVELEQARSENETLKQQLAQAHDAYQQRIEGLTQLLKQAPPIAQPSVIQPIKALETSTKTTVAPELKPQPPMATTRRHITTTGTADQRIEGAMRAVMTWNREHDSDSAKFAITQSLLQKCTGSNMAAVKRVMSECRNEIHEHNSEYALDPDRHNYGMSLDAIKAFVQGRL